MELCIFSKHFQSMKAEQLGETFAELGVKGVDLTVRGGGHVEPSKVKEDLGRFKDTLAEYGVKVSMLTTSIIDIKQPESVEIIKAAGKAGVIYIKLGYWLYKGFGHYREQEKEIKKALKEMEPVLRDNGVKAGFHSHSGNFMGLNANYVLRLIEDTDPEVHGVYYDTGHNTVEGSVSGWVMDLDLVSDRLFMVALKNIAWFFCGDSLIPTSGKYADGYRNGWECRVVPLANGFTDTPAFVKLLNKISFKGPLSFHSEYQGTFSWSDLTDKEVVEQTRRDIAFFKSLKI